MRLDMIGLTVASIERSLRFYRTLGLEVPFEWEGPYVEITLAGGIRLSWNDVEMVKGIYPEWKPAVGQRVSLAFRCDSVSDVDERYQRLVGEGYRGIMAPFDAFWGQRYAVIEDPDGNSVDIFHPLDAGSQD